MNKKYQKILLAASLWSASIISSRSNEISSFNEGFGSGTHVIFSPSMWDGHEITISQLAKNGNKFTFAKTSDSIYKVWLEREDGRTPVFCFGRGGSITISVPTYMVDVWMEGDDVSILVTDGHAFSFIRSTRKLPALAKGMHYLMRQLDDQTEWKTVLVMVNLEFGDADDSVISDIYQSVKLVSINEIELTYKVKPERATLKQKLIQIKDSGKIALEGKELPYYRKPGPAIISEEDLRQGIKSSTPAKIKEEMSFFGSKQRALEFFNAFDDRELAKTFMEIVEAAFKEGN